MELLIPMAVLAVITFGLGFMWQKSIRPPSLGRKLFFGWLLQLVIILGVFIISARSGAPSSSHDSSGLGGMGHALEWGAYTLGSLIGWFGNIFSGFAVHGRHTNNE
ncbi:MAG: hypothetical protein COB08_012350 [Rhodobacteraceae bacterium]|nr:hypothetical protein [Paracoccaceae bacterium]